MSAQIELITSKTCPFAQRTAILLLEKGVDFTTTYIDLSTKPDWFLQLSPLGKIPLLRVDGNVLFESAIINEYLDEVYPPSIHPKDPLQRANNRAWIEFSSDLIFNSVHLMRAIDAQTFQMYQQTLMDKLKRLETTLVNTPYFNGAQFSLVDIAFAPLFIRFAELSKYYSHPFVDSPKVKAWSEHLLAKHSVQTALAPDYAEIFLSVLKQRGGHLTQILQLA